MTDITELAQSLKAAAGKATPGPWYVHDKPCEDGNYGIDTSDKEFLAEAVVWWGFSRQSIWREEDAKYIALANPANIRALVEALEKAQERIAELSAGKVGNALLERENHHVEVVGKLTDRISELESRTVKLPEVRITIAEAKLRNLTHQQHDAYNAGASRAVAKISQELTAAGIKWEDE